MAKGHVTFNLLERLWTTATNSVDLFEAFLDAGYGASYKKIEYSLSKIRTEKATANFHKELEREAKIKYNTLIYKLKRDGLVVKSLRNGLKIFTITMKGKNKLEALKTKIKKQLPSPKYEKKETTNPIIVAFDIPEKERRKRNWLRDVLKNLGFRIIQKSVWAGKVKIPKRFLEDLKKLRLIDFVEIFEVSKAGSLKQVI
ncbi:MAG: CRISPR-associated endonuclease Cas2 [Patescibacteria group bacterium]|mgnify:CR=1 FL=1